MRNNLNFYFRFVSYTIQTIYFISSYKKDRNKYKFDMYNKQQVKTLESTKSFGKYFFFVSNVRQVAL